MEYSGQSRVLSRVKIRVWRPPPATSSKLTHHARRTLYGSTIVELCAYAYRVRVQSQSQSQSSKVVNGRSSVVTCVCVCVEIITTGLARTGTRARRMEPEWDYGIMELWNPAQTTARVRDQDGTGQDGQDRTGQDKAPVATGPRDHRSRTRATGKRVLCYGVHMLMRSHAAMQPCSSHPRGLTGGGRGVHDSIRF